MSSSQTRGYDLVLGSGVGFPIKARRAERRLDGGLTFQIDIRNVQVLIFQPFVCACFTCLLFPPPQLEKTT